MITEVVIPGSIILAYVVLNLYVRRRIQRAWYLDEGRRRIHLWLIWLFPFLGPVLIRGFWKKPKEKGELEVVTKERRRKRNSGMFGGGVGFIPGDDGGPSGNDMDGGGGGLTE